MKPTFKRSNVLLRISDTFLVTGIPSLQCKVRVPQTVHTIYNKSVIKKIFFR
jgi:hypothetical protein